MSEWALHANPVWRDRADFIVDVEIDPGETQLTREQLWVRKVTELRFELCCIPFFAYDLALGDVVTIDAEHLVQRVVEPSGRIVFRAFFLETTGAERPEVASELAALGAQFEVYSPRLMAIDAVNHDHAQVVANYLQSEEDAGRLIYETGRS